LLRQALFLVLPLVFLSSVIIASGLMPAWMGRMARFSPVDWAVVASREALGAAPDVGVVLGRGACSSPWRSCWAG
jgi:ABC-2 type transport system permease protein